MKKIKSLMLLMSTMLILTIMFCMNASAAEWVDVPYCENTQYTFDEETGVMVIKCEGALKCSYFSEICPDHYAPEDDVFGCTCQKGVENADPSDEIHPGRDAASKTKTLIIQEGVTAIDVRAFNGFTNLEVAILPQSLTKIPAGAFTELEKLHTVVLSNSLTSIGEQAFYKCANLKNIYMSATLKSVGKNAFYGCDKEFIRIPSSATVEAEQPEKVKNLTITENNNTVTLTWDKSANAEGYIVKFTDRYGDDDRKTTTKNTTYTVKLSPAKCYYISVTPYLTYNGKIVEGYGSWDDSYVTKPEVPEVSAVISDSNSIKLSWTDNNDKAHCKYKVYIKGNNGWITKAITERCSFEFNVRQPGVKYSFAVRPYADYYAFGSQWGDYTIITAAITPSTVTAKATSPSKGKINLTWNKVDGDIDGYRVYYKVGNGEYKIYKNYGSAQNLTFSNLKSGTKYTFAVRAGIKTSGGVVWSGYNETTVTVK